MTGESSEAWCSSNWVEGNKEAADIPDTGSLDFGMLMVTVSQPATTVSCDGSFFPG